MPNTLAHIGIQGLATRSIIKDADYKWIYIGCIVPDAPWILQRFVRVAFSVDPYDLRLYATVQSSFLFCIILSFLLATFAKQYWRVFIILSINSFLHLILDSLQMKWANGVHLFAPFDWQFINFGLFWPENVITYILTAFGILYFWMKWPDRVKSKAELAFRPIPLILILLIYVSLPFLFLSGPEDADNHFVKTLRSVETREGKYIEVDRAKYITKNKKNMLRTYAKEEIEVEGINQNNSNNVSIKGTFIHNKLIRVSNYHTHHDIFRDIASYAGLLLVLFYWFCSILNKSFQKQNLPSKSPPDVV